RRLGYRVVHSAFFDTVAIETQSATAKRIHAAAKNRRINLRAISSTRIGVALDETTSIEDVQALVEIFALGKPVRFNVAHVAGAVESGIPESLRRSTRFLTHEVFNKHRSETEMLRYLKRLEDRDLSLTSAMIPLGSCTMKLNATAEMLPITWPGFNKIHPFAP